MHYALFTGLLSNYRDWASPPQARILDLAHIVT
jgi:hypothetical protein